MDTSHLSLDDDIIPLAFYSLKLLKYVLIYTIISKYIQKYNSECVLENIVGIPGPFLMSS